MSPKYSHTVVTAAKPTVTIWGPTKPYSNLHFSHFTYQGKSQALSSQKHIQWNAESSVQTPSADWISRISLGW